ncbi:DUF748 domain-containing protein [Saccharicrinis aurantiacus]|uniref:DUF748 domain-containing protein n=1 Tax=Saccharicrinis aurantiacus TaxID=1849719 RepID=UPI00094F515A|nr:DUF748 domain-containing protein [Saccharicrinis aurantiacus]
MKLKYKILLLICVLSIITITSCSVLIKKYITKNSIELIGNRIDIGSLHFNPLTFAIKANDVKIFETNNINTLASIDQIFLDFSPIKLIDNEYSISKFTISGLNVKISQYDSRFNFDDAFEPLRNKSNKSNTQELKYSIYNIELKESNIVFSDKNTGKQISLNAINFQLPKLAWNNTESEAGLNLKLGDNGSLYLRAQLDDKNKRYQINCKVNEFDLNGFEDYISEYFNITKLNGLLNFNYNIEGSLSDINDIKISGVTTINDLSVFDGSKTEIANIKDIEADIYYYKPTKSSLYLRTIEIREPNTKLIIDATSNNWSKFLQKKHSDSVVEKSTMNYMIRKISVVNGNLLFNDKRLNPEISTEIQNITASISNISNETNDISATYEGLIKSGGKLHGTASLSTGDIKEWQVNANLTDLPLVNYSKFSSHYLSRPILNGSLDYQFKLKLSNNHITNNNKLTFSNIVFGDKQKSKTAYKVPVQTAFNILKDKRNTVTIDIPIVGDRNNENFILTEEIRTAFIQYLKGAGKTKIKHVGKSINELTKDAEAIRLNFGKSKIPFKQEVILSKAADKIKSGELKKLQFYPITNPQLDKEELAFQQVKIQYLKSKQRSKKTNDNLLKVKLKLLSDNKPALIKYINAQTSLNQNESIYSKCINIIGANETEKLYQRLIEDRNVELVKQLTSKLNLNPSHFEIKTTTHSNELSSPIYQLKEITAGSGIHIEFEDNF